MHQNERGKQLVKTLVRILLLYKVNPFKCDHVMWKVQLMQVLQYINGTFHLFSYMPHQLKRLSKFMQIIWKGYSIVMILLWQLPIC